MKSYSPEAQAQFTVESGWVKRMGLSIAESPFGGRVIRIREFSGLRFVDGVYAAQTRVPDHSHQQAVFCIALNGACAESFAGRVRSYEAMSIEFLPPYQNHSLNFQR